MFERFTTRARSAVVHAQEEARGLLHDYIGTEHLMLALLRDPESLGIDILAGLGVTYDSMKAEVMRITPPGDEVPTGHIPFTPRAKKVLELSLREALALNHKTIEAEHILLGLIREGKGLAAQVMTGLGADLPTVRRQVMMRMGAPGGVRMMHQAPPGAPHAMTKGAMGATEQAMQRAQSAPVGSHHYLLGILDEEKGLGAKALAQLGVTREKIEGVLAALDPRGTSDEPPERAGAGRTSLEVEDDVVSIRLKEPDLAQRLSPLLGRFTAVEWGPEQVWKAVRPALDQLAERLERELPIMRMVSATELMTGSGLAAYSVSSTATGLEGQLWTAPMVDRQELRQWLAEQIETTGPGRLPTPRPDGEGCIFFTVMVSRRRLNLPVTDPEAWELSRFEFGRWSQPGWKEVPPEDLLAFAVSDLRGPAIEATG